MMRAGLWLPWPLLVLSQLLLSSLASPSYQASCAVEVSRLVLGREAGLFALFLAGDVSAQGQDEDNWLAEFVRDVPVPRVLMTSKLPPFRWRSYFFAGSLLTAEELRRSVGQVEHREYVIALLWVSNTTGGVAPSHVQKLATALWEAGVLHFVAAVWKEDRSSVTLFSLSRHGLNCGPSLDLIGSADHCTGRGSIPTHGRVAAFLKAYTSIRHLSNLQGCALRVVTSEKPPHVFVGENGSVLEEQSTYYPSDRLGVVSGFNVLFLKEVAKRLNATLHFHVVTDGTGGGLRRGDGNLTGCLRELTSHKAHMASGLFQITLERTPLVEFVAYAEPMRLVIIVPKCIGKMATRWTGHDYLFSELSPATWMIVGLSLVMVATALWLMSLFVERERVYTRGGYRPGQSNLLLILAGFNVEVPAPARWLVCLTTPLRIIVAAWMLGCLVISSVNKGELLSELTSRSGDCDIHTLEELLDSGLALYSPRVTLRMERQRPFHTDTERLVLQKARAAWPEEVRDKIMRVAENRDSTVFVELMEAVYLAQELGRMEKLHFLVAFSRPLHGLLMFPKGSLLTPQIRRICHSLSQGGIWNYWLRLYFKNPTKPANRERALTLQDMGASFFVLLFGLLTATASFILEISGLTLKRHLSKDKDPQLIRAVRYRGPTLKGCGFLCGIPALDRMQARPNILHGRIIETFHGQTEYY